MRKVWIYKRKEIKGWWIGWYESGKRKAKALPAKALAEHYCQIKNTQLNSDVFTGTVNVGWQQMVEEYRYCKQVAGVVKDSLYEVAFTLRNFERLVGKCNFKQYRWNKIREKLGLGDFKFHDLRKTFGSILAQNGISTAVTQRLLEHSSPNLTNKVYTNVDPVLRQAVDQIPAGDWL